MAKDHRYATARFVISGGGITTFNQILKTIPKTLLSRDLKIHAQTVNGYINNPEKITFEFCFGVAALIECDVQVIVDLVLAECKHRKKQ